MARRSPGVLGYAVAAGTSLLGIGSLLLFALFIWRGGLALLDSGWSAPVVLLWDAGLCAIFFLQHSGLIRESFRNWFVTVAPEPWYGVIYTVTSAASLGLLVVFWQTSDVALYTSGSSVHLLMRAILLCSLAGFLWTFGSLREFDAFGTKAFLRQMRGKPRRTEGLTVRGPYRFVRHPFYAVAVVAIWATPTLTLDRLLFNALFTAWIILGAHLEERDLSAAFGEHYRNYQREVPMFIPGLRGLRKSAAGKRPSEGG